MARNYRYSQMTKEKYQYVRPEWESVMQAEYLSFYQTGELTDIALKVEGRIFRCHKLILCAASSYFKAMFTSNFSEASKDEIELGGMDADAFCDVIMFIYSGKLCIKKTNTEYILNIACMLDLEDVKEACADFLESTLNIDNCTELLLLADKYDIDDLTTSCVQLIVQYFSRFVANGGVGQIPSYVVTRILNHEQLPVASEKEVALAALEWVVFNPEDRAPELCYVFSAVRLTELSPQFIKCSLLSNPLVRNNVELSRKLNTVLDHLSYGFTLTRDINVNHPRISTGLQHELLIFCESMMDNGGSADWVFKLYRDGSGEIKMRECRRTTQDNPSHKKTLTIRNRTQNETQTSQERSVLPYFGTCISDNCLYASGYTTSTSMLERPTPVFRYDPVRRNYYSCSPLPAKRKSHQLVAGHKGIIYALGGYEYTDVEGGPLRKNWCMYVDEYDISMNRWRRICSGAPLRLNVRPYYPCVFYAGNIYVITAHLDIISYNCETGVYKEVRVKSDDLSAVFGSGRSAGTMVASTVYKDTLIISSTSKDGKIIMFDMQKLKELVDSSKNGAQKDGLPLQDDVLRTENKPRFAFDHSNQGWYDIHALAAFGPKILAVASYMNSSACILSCDADELCYDPECVQWERVFSFRVSHVEGPLEVKKLSRAKMYTVVGNYSAAPTSYEESTHNEYTGYGRN